MKDYLSLYSGLLSNSLQFAYSGNEYDPILANEIRFNLRGAFIALIAYQKVNQPTSTLKSTIEPEFSELQNWVESYFGSGSVFSLILASLDETLKSKFHTLLKNNFDVRAVNLYTINEILLGIEGIIGEKKIEVITDKNIRNALGSYYTPHSMAYNMVVDSVSTFLSQNYNIQNIGQSSRSKLKEIINVLSKLKVADFSCGGGIFFSVYLEYVGEILSRIDLDDCNKKELLKKIVSNIHGYDLDPLALELAKLNTIRIVSSYSSVLEANLNFIHCNFLLQNDEPVKPEEKIRLFKQGYIYDKKLGLNRSKITCYDLILGNPPWERIRFEEKKFYALHANFISASHVKSERTEKINEIKKNNSSLGSHAEKIAADIDLAKDQINEDKFFKLSSPGELNTYALFTEACYRLINNRGVFGILVKSSIITSQANKEIFNELVEKNKLVKIIDFVNRKKIFPIDGRTKFCFLVGANRGKYEFALKMNQTEESFRDLNDEFISLSKKSLEILNPQTGMIPNISSKKEVSTLLSLTKKNTFFYKAHPRVKFGRLVHFTNHSDCISKQDSSKYIPVYEGKFINQFDSKYSGFDGVKESDRYKNRASSKKIPDEIKKSSHSAPESRFFIHQHKWKKISKNYSHANYMLAWRSATSSTNKRTCIATILPFTPTSQSIQFLITRNNHDLIYLCGLFNSVVFDYLAKKNISGIDLTQTIIKQLPVPKMSRLAEEISFNGQENTIKNHIIHIVKQLISFDDRLNELTNLYEENEFLPVERELQIKYLDLLFFYAYDVDECMISPILEEFPKTYSLMETSWFQQSLNIARSNKSISSPSRLITHVSPING